MKTAVLRTFRAWLKGSYLEWVDDVPELGEQRLQVHVTVLDEQPVLEAVTRGQKMAKILEKLATTHGINNIDPVGWQQETRQDRSLPGR